MLLYLNKKLNLLLHQLTLLNTEILKISLSIFHLKINKHEDVGFPFTLLVLFFQFLLAVL